MEYKTLKDLGDIKGVPVLLRLDLNTPVENGVVVDDYRIRKSLPTILFLKDKGAKIVIISHIEGGTDTLEPVHKRLGKDVPLIFCKDCLEEGSAVITNMNAGDVMLCENIRLYDGEKKNDPEFAKKLASLASIYVNDGFSVSHRKHASIVGVPKFLPGYLGLQFEEEIKNLSKCFNPPHPFLFILGGAKFDTKLPLVQKFLPIAENIFIGGALANDFFKAKGFEVGKSLLSEVPIDLSGYISDPKISLPTDVVVSGQSGNTEKETGEIKQDESIFDAGSKTVATLKGLISSAKCVLWNGPLGLYEKGYKQPTLEIAEALAESSAMTVVGGGDTLAAIQELNIENKLGFVSTGGGAMLDFLANGTLPGLEALKSKQK